MAPSSTTETAPDGPLVIAHRGASDYLLEHTLEGYAAGHLMGADFVEPDVVATADGVLICNHDIALDRTTNVQAIYPDRARADGNWYAIDFTLDEIRRLRREPRSAEADSTRPPGGSTVPTLEEMIVLVQRLNERTGRNVGVIPELKRPGFHQEEGISTERLIAKVLERRGYTRKGDPAVIQCFDWSSLGRLRRELGVELRLLALTDAEEAGELDLDAASAVADWVGPSRRLIENVNGTPAGGRALVERAHERGLAVACWTFKNEPDALARFYYEYGVDGIFADDPAAARRAADRA